jgi:putative tryptophan/tyrosine transport system substrate-binding protein
VADVPLSAIFGPEQGKKDSAMTDPVPSAVPLPILTGFLGSHQLTRRKVISLLGGAAAAWPLAARAQQSGRLRLIGVLSVFSKDDPEGTARDAAFQQTLADLGWTVGRNVRIDYRWTEGDTDRLRKYAAELVALAPDVILTQGSQAIGPVLQQTRTVPIVFVSVDPVGSGHVASLARPGGNATGFTQFEYRIAGKWLELLQEIAPSISQVAVIRDPRTGPGIGQFAVIQAVAPVGAGEIERGIAAFARSPNGGLIVTSGGTAFHRDLIISLVARHRLPAVYPYRYYSTAGGLISYGPNTIEPVRRAASYIDRILKGEKPADLPVQAPTKYEFVINRKTAKALGVTVPDKLLALADEVIE